MTAVDSVRVNSRNQKLNVRAFPPSGQPKAVLVWHHGKDVLLQPFDLRLRTFESREPR